MGKKLVTVAAAIRRIKKLKGELGVLDARLKSAVVYVEGKEPPFLFGETMMRREEKLSQLLQLQTALSISNAATSFSYRGGAVSVAWAIRKTQEIKALASLYAELPVRDRRRDVETKRETVWDDVTDKHVREAVETVYVSAITKVDQAAAIESLTAEFEELNTALEACNHDTKIEVDWED